KDGIFSEKLLLETYNADLVNTIGNLISRTISMIKQNFSKPIAFKDIDDDLNINTINLIVKSFENYKENLDNFRILESFECILNLARNLNKYIDLTMPWKLKDDLDKLSIILNILLNGCYAILAMIEIVCPDYVKEFKQIFNINEFDFEQINNFHKFDNIVVNENKIVFSKFKQ
ncbi:MAG: methionine--tRNA ligase, partial [Mycoplasmataceae bacterium]|nr:methionine--tRNA ligase [Mycoplasmataceae bacterium]